MKLQLLKLLRLLEVVGGMTIFALGLWMWLDGLLIDFAHGQKVLKWPALVVFMMWVAPAIVVLVGCFLQTLRRKRWPVVLVLIGCAYALPFVGFNALFIFGYTGDKWGQRVVYTDLVALAVTAIVSMLNVAFHDILPVNARANEAA